MAKKSYFDSYMDKTYASMGVSRLEPVKPYTKYNEVEDTYTGKRTALDRVFDVLNVGQYVSAGLAQAIVEKSYNPLEYVGKALKGANPFGADYKEGEYSYSQVLEKAGWVPESTGGKIAKGLVGFAGDVFLDPVNYLTGGLKGVLQGTGKHAMKGALGGAELLDLLGDSAKFVDNIGDLNKSIGMSQEVAEAIIKNSKVFKAGNVVDVAADAADLVKQFNKVIGITAAGSADITWSFANVPFGKKIFGSIVGPEIASKQYKVMSGEALKLLGDSTFAPFYAPLRNAVYGGKIGKLFSSSHDLYKISQTDPEKVYDFIKFSEVVQGLGGDKNNIAKVIRNEAERLMDMSPAQSEELLTLMEDKTVWHKVKQTVNFFDTKEAEVFKSNIETKKSQTVEKLREYENFIKENAEEGAAIDKKLKGAMLSKKEALEAVNMEKTARLLEVEAEYIDNLADAKKYMEMLNDTALEFDVKTFDVDMDDIEYIGKRYEKYKSSFTGGMPKADSVLDPKSLGDDFVKGFTKPDDMPSSTYYRLRKELGEAGFKEYRSTSYADKALERLGEGWEKVTMPDGKVRVYPPGGMPKGETVEEVIGGVIDKVTKEDVVNDLSKHIFGAEGFLSAKTYDRDVEKLMEYATKHTREETLAYVLINDEFYNGKAAEMYSYIGETIGYGQKSKHFKSWDEYYTNRRQDLLKKLNDGTIDKTQMDILNKIEADNLKRNVLKRQFKDAKTTNDVRTIIAGIQETSLEDLVHDYEKDVRKLRLQMAGEYGLEEAGDKVTAKKSFHKADKRGTNFTINDAQRDHIKYKYSKLDYVNNDGAEAIISSEKSASFMNVRSAKDRLDTSKSMLKQAKADLKALDTGYSDPSMARSFHDSLERKQLLAKQIKTLEAELPMLNKEYISVRNSYNTAVKPPKQLKVNVAENRRMDRIIDEMEYIMENIYGKEFGQLSDEQVATVFKWAENRDFGKMNGKSIESLGKETAREIMDEVEKRSLAEQVAEVKVKHAEGLTIKDGRFKGQKIMPNTRIKTYYEGEEVYAVIDKIVENSDGGKSFEVTMDGIPKKWYDKHVVGERNIIDVLGIEPPRDLDGFRWYDKGLDDFMSVYDDTSLQAKKKITEIKEVAKEIPRTSTSVVEMEYIPDESILDMKNRDFLSNIDAQKLAKVEALESQSNKIIQNIDKQINMWSQKKIYNEMRTPMNISEIMDNLQKDINSYDKLLTNANAFDTYIQSSTEFGVISKTDFDKIISDYNPDMGKYILDETLDLDPKVKENLEWMRGRFLEIAEAEVEINKLKVGQLDANAYDYLPHILTEDGAKFFSNDEVMKKFAGFGEQQGFGREFSPFSRSRTIKWLPEAMDELDPTKVKTWIEDPNIKQINEFFYEAAGNKNVFSDNLHEIYLVRALKNNELMYDNKYMESMLDLFGEGYDGVLMDNHSVAMNYGKLKDYSLHISNSNAALDQSDMISEHLSRKDVYQRINQQAAQMFKDDPSVPYRKVHSDLMGEEVQNFIKTNFTEEFKRGLYEKTFQDFLDNTKTGGLLDDVGMPMTQLDDLQVKSLSSASEQLRERQLLNIKKSLNSFFGYGKTYDEFDNVVSEISPFIERMSLDDVISNVNRLLPEADAIDHRRLSSILEKVEKFNNIQDPQIRQVQNAIMNKANQSRKIAIMKDQSELLKMYDSFTHFMKVNQTAVLPGFHGRNKTSNMFNNWLMIGQDATDIGFQKEAAHAMQFNSGKEGLTDIRLKLKAGGDMSWNEVVIAAQNYDVIGSGMYAQEIGVGNQAFGKGLLSGFGVPGKFDPTDMKNFGPYRIGTKVGTAIEDHDKLIHFASQVKNGMNFKEAAESAQRALFDYGDLTMFEQTVMKRIFPYYTWLRKNGQYQIEMMLEHPEKFRMTGKVLSGISNSVNDEDKINMAFVNEFAHDWIQTPFSVLNPKGKMEPVLLNPNMPFMDVGRIPNPLRPGESAKEMFTQMNPIFKVPIELAMNHNAFFESPIAKEDESKGLKSAEYVASQLGVYPIIKGLVQKDGMDLALHALNHSTGVKLLSYDYDTYKPMKILEIMDEQYAQERVKRQLKRFGSGIVEGFATQMSYAKSAIDTSIDRVADIAYNDRPIRPDEYVNSLRPISEDTYQALPEDQKLLYTPPTENDAMRYTQKAVEMEKQALQETGKAQRFIWSLIESRNLGTRNEPYQFGKVTDVKDGDTFDMNVNGRKETVRLLLIDTAETEKKDYNTGQVTSETQPFADEAWDFAKNALIDKDVKIYVDGTERDTYGRLLAYVEVDGVDYAQSALEAGMAQTGYIMEPPYKRLPQYQEAERSAHSSSKGIWGMKGYAEPDGNANYSSQYNMGDYNDYKRQKFKEILKKKQDFKINPNPMDNILKQLPR